VIAPHHVNGDAHLGFLGQREFQTFADITARTAGAVGQLRVATVGAARGVDGLESVVRATHLALRAGFTLARKHGVTS